MTAKRLNNQSDKRHTKKDRAAFLSLPEGKNAGKNKKVMIFAPVACIYKQLDYRGCSGPHLLQTLAKAGVEYIF